MFTLSLLEKQLWVIIETLFIQNFAYYNNSTGMSLAVEELIGQSHLVKGITILPFEEAQKYFNDQKLGSNQIYPSKDSKIAYYYGARKNLPDIDSCRATQKVLDMCHELQEDDLLLTLISGGGSALLGFTYRL